MIGAPPLVWIVGRGGLLGGAIDDLWSVDSKVVFWSPDAPVRWTDERVAAAQLIDGAHTFLRLASTERRPWRILWCAGAGVVATGADALAGETRLNVAFLVGLGDALDLGVARDLPGAYFLASSAGGVYGGSASPPPYDENSPVGAISPYGREKLAQESAADDFARASDVPTLIGRISNLYGPGQDVSKPQGLISQIGRAALRRRAVSIYVSLDTIRDYLFVADAAVLITRAIERLEIEAAVGPRRQPGAVVKVIASEMDSTVASVLAAWRQVLPRAPGVALAANPAAHLQPRCLSFRSVVWPDLRIEPVPLPTGVHAVLQDQLRRLRAGELS